MTLSEKIAYINRIVPFSKVLYQIHGLMIESTQQIYCIYHQDINEKSARVYINNRNDGSDGLYCFKCGNYSTFKIVFESLDENIPDTLKWFEDNYNIIFKDGDKGSNSREDIKIAKMVLACKKHSQQVSWSGKDVNRLGILIKKYKDDTLTDFRLNKLYRKLNT